MKKFYKTVDVVKSDNEFSITLDNKPIKTPAGALLSMPSESLAKMIAQEWDDIKDGEKIKPETMGYMQLVSTAIDKVLPNILEVSHNVVGYAMNDLLCYRAEDNPELREIQSASWDKWIYWVNESANIDLVIGKGITPVNQSPAVKVSAMLLLNEFDGFRLTVMADLTAIYGSFVLAMAVMSNKISMLDAYEVSRVDELYQISQWGIDDLAEETAEVVRTDLKKTEKLLKLL